MSASLIPYPHQLEGARRLAENDTYALLMSMGTGKTRTILLDIQYRVERGDIDRVVYIAPSGCYRNFSGEIEKWLPEDFRKRLNVFTWVSGKSSSKKDLKAFLSDERKTRILIMNVEALSRVELAKEGLIDFLKGGRAMFIVDESQSIKAPTSLRTKFILKAAELAKYRRIMTGLVAPENPLNIFSQFYFLDPTILGHRTFFSFRARYAVTRKVDFRKEGGRPTEIVVGYKNVDELQKKIASKSYRVCTEDVLDLPEKIYMPIRDVPLTMEQIKAYNDMKKWAMTEVGGAYVTAQIAAAVLTKLHAILCGHVVDENGKIHDIATHRVDAIKEVLEDHSGKAIIWCPYPRLLEKIAQALEDEYGKESVVRYWGETKSDERVTAVDRFQNDPKCKYFVSNPSVGGEGITLTAGSLVVYAANSWKASDRQQSEARAHRAGQTKSVTYVDLAAQGTMEHKLIRALRNKFDLAALVTGDKLREWII